MSKKKIVLIIIAIIVVLASVAGLIYCIGLGTKTENKILEGNTSKVSKLYDELAEKQTYIFTTKLDENSQVYYAKKGDMAYIDASYQGDSSKMLVKDGNSYLLLEDEKVYYTYQNNETDLERILLQLQEVKEKQYKEGKEKIEGKEYRYEEYEGISDFLMKEDVSTAQEQKAKTRFYFNKDQLVYIKTIIDNEQEILKVEMSDSVDNKLFEIPSEYKEM